MKKLFFLFAASALLVACSSDDSSETTGGGSTTTPTEQYVSSRTIGFTNGTSMSIGDLDGEGNPATRSGECVNFTVDFKEIFYNEARQDVLEGFGEYVIRPDDFAIRVDGQYVPDIKPDFDESSGTTQYDNCLIKIVENNMKFSVNNLQNLDFTSAGEYTFEMYVWVENKKMLEDGTYGELFTDADKFNWIGFDNSAAMIDRYEDLPEGTETGLDLSYPIWKWYATDAGYFFKDETNREGEAYDGYTFFNTTEGGYLVRFNAYRGLQGVNGNTPYFKLSVHVSKQKAGGQNENKNQAYWVGNKFL